MNSMNNDGNHFRARNPTLLPQPLARAYSDQVNIGLSQMFFDRNEGGRIEGNGNDGDFRSAAIRTPLRQERPVLFMRPLDN